MARAAPKGPALDAAEAGEHSAHSASRERRVGVSHEGTAGGSGASMAVEPDIELLLGHEPAALVELADAFLDQLAGLPDELGRALAAADLGSAERAVHSVRPAAVLFRELALASDAANWQELVLAGDTVGLASQLAHVREACRAAADRVRSRRAGWASRISR